MPRHPDILQWFDYEHLPQELQEVPKAFRALALMVCDNLPACEERNVALRKLLEAKDAADRAKVYERNGG